MSTLKTAYLQHPSATNPNITLNSDETVSANGLVSTSSVSGNVIVVTGERNTAFTGTGQNLPFGNGNQTREYPFPYAGKVIAAALKGGGAHTGTTTMQLVKNGTVQGSSYQLSVTGIGTVDYEVFGTPLAFAAGDSINLTTTAISSPADGVSGSIVIRFD